MGSFPRFSPVIVNVPVEGSTWTFRMTEAFPAFPFTGCAVAATVPPASNAAVADTSSFFSFSISSSVVAGAMQSKPLAHPGPVGDTNLNWPVWNGLTEAGRPGQPARGGPMDYRIGRVTPEI